MGLVDILVKQGFKGIKEFKGIDQVKKDQVWKDIKEVLLKPIKEPKNKFQRIVRKIQYYGFAFMILMVMTTGWHSRGQQVVNDPTANVTLTSQLKVAMQTLKNSMEQSKTLKDMKDDLAKINKAVTNLKYIDRAIDRQKKIVKVTKSNYNRMKKSDVFTPKELALILQNFTYVVTQSSKNLKVMEMILTPDEMKMSDAERLRELRELDKEMTSLTHTANMLNRKYQRIATKRKMHQIYKRRTS